jgi:hypothetical protein
VSGSLALAALTAPAYAVDGSITFSQVKVNGGKPIVLGTTATRQFTITYTAEHADPLGDAGAWAKLYHGPYDTRDAWISSEKEAVCKDVSATTTTCTQSLIADPALSHNADAGTWHAQVCVVDSGNFSVCDRGLAPTLYKRASRLTANAGPEPVTKGKKITITGKLTRANWEKHDYRGYTSQPVKLQFRKAGTSTYKTVRTVNTNSYGNLKTTVTASTDGYWRYSFAGTSTTAPVTTAGDFLDVR